MTSSADLEKWKSLGGTVQEVKKRKRYIAPTGCPGIAWFAACSLPSVDITSHRLTLCAPGEEYGSWEAANIYLERYGASRGP